MGYSCVVCCVFFVCQAEDGIRDLVRSRGLGDVYKRQVLITELLNSGIEAAIDRIGPELHDLSKRAKDMGLSLIHI